MSASMENFMREFNLYLDELPQRPNTETEMNKALQDFMKIYNDSLDIPKKLTESTAKTSYDFMELAETAKSKKKRLAYLEKAYELDDHNFDAALDLIIETVKGPLERHRRVQELLEKAIAMMKAEGFYTKDCIGDFWQLAGTRPFMRLYRAYMDELAAQDKFRLAAETGQEMLRLCKNDNLGIRFVLMDYYAVLQERKPAEKLFKKYKDSTALLSLPMSYMYYQLGDEKNAQAHLQIMLDNVKDTKKFFNSKGHIPDCYRPSPYGIQLGTMDEYYDCFTRAASTLYENAEYWEWAKETIKGMKKS